MRQVFYKAVQDGFVPTNIEAGVTALAGYDGLCEQNDLPVTTFKNISIFVGRGIPDNEMRFYSNGVLVGVIKDIS